LLWLFFCRWSLANYLPVLAFKHDPSYLCLLSN
jgi:hypothetical protein